MDPTKKIDSDERTKKSFEMKRVAINKQLEICIVVCIHQHVLTDILRDRTLL